MTGSVVMDIVTLCVVAVATCIKEFVKTKDEHGNVTGGGKIYTVIIIIALGINIVSKLAKSDEEKQASIKREDQYKETIDKSKAIADTLSIALDTARIIVRNTDSSIGQLAQLQERSNIIIDRSTQLIVKSNLIVDSLNHELALQRNTNIATQSILTKSQKLMDTLNYTKENTDKGAYPLLPVTLSISLLVPFENDSLKNLMDTIWRIKSDIDSGRSIHPEFVTTYSPKNGKAIETMLINNPEKTLGGAYKNILGNGHMLYFRKKPEVETLFKNDVFLELILDFDSRIPRYFDVLVDFRNNWFYVNYYYAPKQVGILYPRNAKISLNELNNNFLLFAPGRQHVKFQVQDFSIFPSNGSKRIIIERKNIGNENPYNSKLFRVTTE